MIMTEQGSRPQHRHNDTLFEVDSETGMEVFESEASTSTSKDIQTIPHVTVTSLTDDAERAQQAAHVWDEQAKSRG